jgi:hypothetical protein
MTREVTVSAIVNNQECALLIQGAKLRQDILANERSSQMDRCVTAPCLRARDSTMSSTVVLHEQPLESYIAQL